MSAAVIERLERMTAGLKLAESHGLPMPWDVDVTDDSMVSLGFDSLDELTQWALYLEAVVEHDDEIMPGRPTEHYNAEGTVAGVPVRCWHVGVVGAS